jgi:hypothetical protein
MTDNQKKFIEEAKIVSEKEKFNYKYRALYIIDSGKQYNGFWGKNGFNYIIIIGRNENGEYINITEDYQCDVYEIQNSSEVLGIRTDISSDLKGCIHHFFFSRKDYFKLTSSLSEVRFKVERED